MQLKRLMLLVLKFYCLNRLVVGRSVKFGSVKAVWNRKYFANYTLDIVNNSVYGNMHLQRSITKGAKIYLNFQTRLPGTKKLHKLLDHVFDFCQMLESLRGASFLRNWYKSLDMKINKHVSHCPIPMGTYKINGWRMETATIPLLLYSGEYVIEGRGYYGGFKSETEDLIAAWEATAIII